MTREQRSDVGAAPAPYGGMSRRKMIIGGAGLAAAGVAAGVAASAVIPIGSSADESAPAEQPAGQRPEDLGGGPTTPEPVVVHLRDVPSGRLELFVGTRHVTFNDRAVADLLVRTAETAT